MFWCKKEFSLRDIFSPRNRMISMRLKSLQLTIHSSQKVDIWIFFGALRFTRLNDINLFTPDACRLPFIPQIENIFEAKFLCFQKFELPPELLVLLLQKHRLEGWESFEIGYSKPCQNPDISIWKKLETRIILSTSAMAPGRYRKLEDPWSHVIKNEYTKEFGNHVKFPW